MGLFLRANAFRGVTHADVFAALTAFWAEHDRPADPVPSDSTIDAFRLHEQRAGWTVLEWTLGWEWTLRRQAQLYVSGALGCPGILVFVYDGDTWGYELFDRGRAVDWFVQEPEEGNTWFPGKDLSGRPEAVVSAFPDLALDRSDVAPYLIHPPMLEDEDGWNEAEEEWSEADRVWNEAEEVWNVPAREGDRFRRGDECAVLDFLGLLGVDVDLIDGYVTWRAPVWRQFRVEPPADE